MRSRSMLIAIATVLLAGQVWLVAGDTDTSETDADENSSGADEEVAIVARDGESWDEHVAVVASMDDATSAPLGTSSTVLDPSKSIGTTSTLTGLVAQAPGVSENGQGGHFQVFSIRGVSRHRVLNLVSGMRVHSERRAGASVSFIDPLLMGTVEVLRGPATTLHGSGALGGVIQVFPRSFEGWTLRTGFDSQGSQSYQVVGYGDESWSLGFARRTADDGETANGVKLNNKFTQYSATVRHTWDRGPRSYELLFIPTFAEDIGKDNSDFPERTTNYPLERHQMLSFAAESANGWRVRGHVHAHDLETDVVDEDELSRNRVFNDSLDYGARWEQEHTLDSGVSMTWGLQVSGRHGVSADETRVSLDPDRDGSISTLSSLDDAREIESGAFATFRWTHGNTEMETGARASWLDQKNGGSTSTSHSAFSGFAGVVHQVRQRVELRGSVSSGVRFPNLSELFFTGTTGSGGIIGNPDLDRERSLNVEVSGRWLGRRVLVNGAVFQNSIDDYIERVGDRVKTFVNLTTGTLRGVELQGLVRATDRWIVDFGGHVIDGRNDDGDRPLADVPPDQVHLGLEHLRDAWTYDARWTHRAGKSDAGPGENPISSANLVRFRVGRRLAGAWSVAVTADNLLDDNHFLSADDKATPAVGRSFGFHLVRSAD